MAQRRVIADSDDSDDELGLEEPVQSRRPGVAATEGACGEAPAMEPLSSQGGGPASSSAAEALDLVRPSSNAGRRASDSTDASFFNQVRDEQRRLARQNMAEQEQASLVENIVKMSQKASGRRGGDKVSFTPLGAHGRADHVSSATDITSPSAQLLQARAKKGARAQVISASEVTTPRSNGAAKDEWDVPSSPEDGQAPKGATNHGRLATSGKRKREAEGKAGLFAGAELETVQVSRSSSDRPVEKGKEASSPSDESIVPNTGNFYIAPSTLTPSQKKQYHRIQSSSGGSAQEGPTPEAGVQLPLSKPKSSCATTVAVSTPSRYASSGPRPSWDLPQSHGQPDVAEETASGSQDMDAEGRDDVIDLTSSPDIIASGNNRRRPAGKQPVTKLPRSLSRVDEEGVQPVGHSPSRRARRRAMDDHDELGNAEDWDSDEVGFHREEYRPRKSRRREIGGGDDVLDDTAHDGQDERMDAAPPTEDKRTDQQQPTEEPPAPLHAPQSPAAPAGDETPQPKKRGRKKKRPPVPAEEAALDELATGLGLESVTATEPAAPTPASEPEPPTEKPKKKRGRPRKSATAKAGAAAPEEKAVEEAALEEMPPTQPFDPAAASAGPAAEEQPPMTEKPSPPEAEAHPGGASKETATESPPAASTSAAPGNAKAAGRSAASPAAAGKLPQQPVYRVGLSKKSRVASLLKIKPRQ